MKQHKLEKTESGKLYCLACEQTWKNKPRSLCPGVPMFKFTVGKFDELSTKYWLIDSLFKQNLRPTTKVCCLKQGKEYTYFYDKEGETEIVDPTLPPVVEIPWYRDCHYEGTREIESCLKTKIGLKKLNLIPGKTEPVAVYYDNGYRNFEPLYNPLDAKIYLQNFPRIKYIYETPPGDLFTAEELHKFNLKPKPEMHPCAAVWQRDDWEFLWDIKQCERDDLTIPPVYLFSDIANWGWVFQEKDLQQFNRQLTFEVKPVGATWNGKGFDFWYNPKDCPIFLPDLPPVIPIASSSHLPYELRYSFKEIGNCLKDEIGLKRLNLLPGTTQPVAVYHSYNKAYYKFLTGEFVHLYNPLDCDKIYIPDLPPVRSWSEYQKSDLLGDRELARWNLKPREGMRAIAVVWQKDDWEFLWDIKQCEIDDTTLPPVVDKQPIGLYLRDELARLNRKATNSIPAVACIRKYGEGFPLLYKPSDCQLINPSLPPCYDKNNLPPHLKSAWGWKQAEPLYQLKKEAIASGCFLTHYYKEGWKPTLLYDRSALELHDREVLLSLTKLKQNYHLSPTLLKQLGKPDDYGTNPINKYYAPVKLYSRKRVEKFLADNAEAYSKHLAKRDKYLAIFEKNKDKLLSPKSREKAQETKRLKKKARKVVNQFNWDDKKKIVITQSIQCLKCASGIAMNDGFFCAINPLGLDIEQMPCKDWQKRKNAN